MKDSVIISFILGLLGGVIATVSFANFNSFAVIPVAEKSNLEKITEGYNLSVIEEYPENGTITILFVKPLVLK